MIERLTNFLKTKITKDQSRDTGMAMVLLLLLFSIFLKRNYFVTTASVLLAIDMLVPQVFRPIAFLWLGLSHLFGTVISKVLLTAIFFAVVTPLGLLRQFLGSDPLKLALFKADNKSVFQVREHRFSAADLERPF